MPFPERVRKQEIAQAIVCQVCEDDFPPDAYIEVHSATSLHLVLDKKSPTPKYVVTDPPKGHENLKGKRVNALKFLKDGIKESDAHCLCPECHDAIHRAALSRAQENEGFRGNTPPPAILEDITHLFIKFGRPDKPKLKITFKSGIILENADTNNY